MSIHGKEIVVGVSGGISAYKAAELVRRLRSEGAKVTCAMTEGAKKFVTPLTFAALTGREVLGDVWEMSSRGSITHVEVGRAAELVIIAPATADHLAHLYGGFAHDAVTALVLASRCPVLIAPAMESAMWENAVTQRNVGWLREQGRYHLAGPAAGPLASGLAGIGRMAEPDEIMSAAQALVAPQDYAALRVVVTAGPTREPLDPVRFLSNRSSGKMGFALAERAARRGAQVTLIHGPVALQAPHGVHHIAIESASQMLGALDANMNGCDILLMAAAVADYTPDRVADQKLKKDELGPRPKLQFTQTPDLLAELRSKRVKATLVGFAAETEDVEAHARRKLTQKGLDLIVANDVSRPGIGFDSDFNKASIYDEQRLRREIPRLPKGTVADHILDEVLRWRREN